MSAQHRNTHRPHLCCSGGPLRVALILLVILLLCVLLLSSMMMMMIITIYYLISVFVVIDITLGGSLRVALVQDVLPHVWCMKLYNVVYVNCMKRYMITIYIYIYNVHVYIYIYICIYIYMYICIHIHTGSYSVTYHMVTAPCRSGWGRFSIYIYIYI